MGVFDRIGNLGKGMLRIIRSDGPTAEERKVEGLEEELAALKAARQVGRDATREERKAQSQLDKLEALHDNGLLSDEEYAAKVADASGLMEVPVAKSEDPPEDPPDDDRPIKKTL